MEPAISKNFTKSKLKKATAVVKESSSQISKQVQTVMAISSAPKTAKAVPATPLKIPHKRVFVDSNSDSDTSDEWEPIEVPSIPKTRNSKAAGQRLTPISASKSKVILTFHSDNEESD